jgi:hypothetical protein
MFQEKKKMENPKPLFDLGKIVATRGVIANEIPQDQLLHCLRRHVIGDWTTEELDKEDIAENWRSIKNNWRILSAFNLTSGRIWIITEADRSSTTILLPDEY